MLLNLSEKEEQVLDEIAIKQDLSKTQVMRQALRLYQLYITGAIQIKDKLLIGIGDTKNV